jgi:hypothetical protein
MAVSAILDLAAIGLRFEWVGLFAGWHRRRLGVRNRRPGPCPIRWLDRLDPSEDRLVGLLRPWHAPNALGQEEHN